MRVKAESAPTLTDRGRVATLLAVRCRDNPADREAWAELHGAVRFLLRRLAIGAARRYRRGGFDRSDLEQAAWLGVEKAVAGYDESRGQFTTYLSPWVIREIRLERIAMESPVRVPVYLRQPIQPQRPNGVRFQAVAEVALRPARSFDPSLHGASAPSDPLRRMESAEESEWLAVMVPQLVEVHRHAPEILRRRLAHAESRRDIGRSLGLTRGRIHQIEALSVRFLVAMAAECGMRDSA